MIQLIKSLKTDKIKNFLSKFKLIKKFKYYKNFSFTTVFYSIHNNNIIIYWNFSINNNPIKICEINNNQMNISTMNLFKQLVNNEKIISYMVSLHYLYYNYK